MNNEERKEKAITFFKGSIEYLKKLMAGMPDDSIGAIACWNEINYITMAIKALEQEPNETVTEFADRCKECGREKVLDKIRAEINELYSYVEFDEDIKTSFNMVRLEDVQRVIDKYKAESEKV